MRIVFDCSCGTSVESTSPNGAPITDSPRCPNCGSTHSVTLTQIEKPTDFRFY